MAHKRGFGRWLLAAAAVTAVTLLVLFAPGLAPVAEPAGLEAQPLLAAPSFQEGNRTFVRTAPGIDTFMGTLDIQIFNEDLVVKPGQVIREDVAVYNGDVIVQAGGKIQGDVAVFRGDVVVAGELDGDLAVMSGDVVLKSSSRVTGDVSTFGGEVKREPGAYVGGNVVGGPRFDFRGPFPGGSEDGVFRFWFRKGELPGSQVRSQLTLADRLLRFFLRLLQAMFWTLLLAALAAFVVWLAPTTVEAVAQTARQESALSFVTGLVTMLGTLFVAFLLAITICLAPAAFLLGALLGVLLLGGWIVTSYLLGQRLAQALNVELRPVSSSAAGALLLTGVTGFLWAISGCLGWLAVLLFGSLGLGAVLVHLARTRAGGGPAAATPEQPGPVPPQEPPASTPEDAEDDLPPPLVTGEAIDLTPEESERMLAALESSPRRDKLTAQQERPPEEAAQGEASQEDEDRGEDDFTRIKGIGPTFDRRLKAANVRRFDELAEMKPEQIAAILGWPEGRVRRDRIVEQARALAKED